MDPVEVDRVVRRAGQTGSGEPAPLEPVGTTEFEEEDAPAASQEKELAVRITDVDMQD